MDTLAGLKHIVSMAIMAFWQKHLFHFSAILNALECYDSVYVL